MHLALYCSLSHTHTVSHTYMSPPSLVSPPPSQHFASVLWEQCDKSQWHPCVRCRVTSALHGRAVTCEYYARGHQHIYHSIFCVNTLPSAKSRITWETAFQQMVWLCHLWKKMEGEAATAKRKLDVCVCIGLMLPLRVFRLPNATWAQYYFHSPSAFCPTSSSSGLREWGHFVRLSVQTSHFLNVVTCSHLQPRVQ